MTPINRISHGALVIGLGLLGFSPMASQAQSAPEEWQFRATVYGWFPGLEGTTEFPSGAGGPSINVNAKDLISGLKMAFMGTFHAQKGQWGGLVDWFYADVGDTKTISGLSIGGTPLPGALTADLSLDVKTSILTLAGTYGAVRNPQYNMNVVFGARMLGLKQRLDYTISGDSGGVEPPVGRSGRVEVSPTNWDAIVGASGRYRFGEGLRWFTPYYVDIGTGNSRFTWQMVLGLGYSFGWGDVVAAWRYTDYDFKSGEAVQSLTMQGPALGVSFSF